MPSSVGGNGGSRDSSNSRSCDSMSSSQRSNSISNSNSNSTSSSRSSQSSQSQGNLAGMNVSRSNSPKESPAAQAAQAARCNPARGNMNGMNVAKSTTPKESPAMQAAQAARCNPAANRASTQASNTTNNTANNQTASPNTTNNTSSAAKAANTQQAANKTADAQQAAKQAEAKQAQANLGNLSVAKTNASTESPVSKTTDAAQAANTTPNAAAISAATTPASQTHTVKAGETLSGIASKANTTVKDIVAANPEITNPNKISVGQQINVPSAAKATEVDALATTPTAVEAIAAKPNAPVNGLTVQQLRAIVPNLPLAKAQEYLPHLNAALAEFNINTPARQAAFVAQLAHESVGLTAFEEFASGRAYEGRPDLGNTQPGDGVRFKGRGPIQLTGRANYREVGKALGIDLENNPKLASTPEVGFRVAGQFWERNGLNKLADAQKFDSITKRVNGGFNGKADRDRYYARAKDVLDV
ncbi:MAG: LysM peptidoglycan-binding domain-containing protein [Acidobacteria bacterium]|nr:LysM peptidoglycan-binding domain-containing protein [Acidobacteriota bacterium]